MCGEVEEQGSNHPRDTNSGLVSALNSTLLKHIDSSLNPGMFLQKSSTLWDEQDFSWECWGLAVPG